MKTINIAVIGAGWIGDIHCECYTRVIPMIREAKIHLHTVADIYEPNAVKAKNKYGFERHVTDWREAVLNPEIDLIDICVDNKFHREIATEAFNNGKHVFCEKPLASDLEEAELMEKEAQESGMINVIDFNYRKVPALAQIKQLIDAGALGKIYHIKGMFLQDFGFTSPMTWRFKKEQSGGGSIITMGAHVIDAVRFLAGEVEEVSALGQTFIEEREIPGTGKRDTCDVDDAMTVLLKFKSGAIGMLMTSWLSHGCKHHHEIEIYGEKGSARFNSERLNEIELFLEDDNPALNGKRTILMGAGNPYGDMFNLKTGMGIGIKESFTIQIRDMLSAIIHHEKGSPSFSDGVMTERISSAIIKAADTHQWVKVGE
ncbi:MAG: Gfo/Idh/MocA family oxidoreductase [Eubacteriales bacterium]|nr:Gfo/Idh/MocA family oxidoreductase [Eubacteriales bacterium]